MAKILGYAVVALKLILTYLSKKAEDPAREVKDDGKSCVRKCRYRKRASSGIDEDESAIESAMGSTSKLSLSSGIGSSICSIDEHYSSYIHGGGCFQLECPETTLMEAEIERLRLENRALREKLTHGSPETVSLSIQHPRRRETTVVWTEDWEETCVIHTRKVNLSDLPDDNDTETKSPSATASKVNALDVMHQKMKNKLRQVQEENSRLMNYINDVMYMVLDNKPQLLEK
ncbi:uncharacterized protein [Haliotis asinina]|uniref:uncharacterized protein n=1 Tax=Haliotis asinina TaxID=109174 RepID=UPI003531A8B6